MFLDPDLTEIALNKLAEEMNPDELMGYFVASQKRLNGIDVVIRGGNADFNIFDRLIQDYPQPKAGWIVKWLFYRHKGKAEWDKAKQIVRVPQLSRSWRWMVEQWSVQYQMQMRRDERREMAPAASGFATLDDM